MTKQDKDLFWMHPKALQILKEAQTKVKLDYDDETLVLGYDRAPDTKYDIWLAVYDERLYWTLDCFDEECNDYYNVEGLYFNRRDIKDVELTKDNLCELSKKIMDKLIKKYEKTYKKENGIQETKNLDRSLRNKVIKLEIDLEKFRYSLVGDGYILEEAKKLSEEDLVSILKDRICCHIEREYKKSKDYELLD